MVGLLCLQNARPNIYLNLRYDKLFSFVFFSKENSDHTYTVFHEICFLTPYGESKNN